MHDRYLLSAPDPGAAEKAPRMTDPKILKAMALVAEGKVTARCDQYLVLRINGAGALSMSVWKARDQGFAAIPLPRRGERLPVVLTQAGRGALRAAEQGEMRSAAP
jgi:hypothetical protein